MAGKQSNGFPMLAVVGISVVLAIVIVLGFWYGAGMN